MKKSVKEPLRVGEVLEHFLSKVGLQGRIQEQKILDLWGDSVGEAIAERTQPMRIQNGVLYVKVNNSVWMQELQFMKGLISQKIQGQSGNKFFHDIHFFIGEIDPPEEGVREKKKRSRKRPLRDVSQEERERIDEKLSCIPDLELREILMSFFSKGLIEKNREEE